MELPKPIADAVRPLFEALPLDHAMSQLVVVDGPLHDHEVLIESVLQADAIRGHDALAAGLWLYVDALDQSHHVSQQIDDATGSFWHGIMHRREGDFGNSHYWFRRVGHHPAMAAIPNYDPHAFIDAVQDARGSMREDLVALQRAEWQALFTWCARQA